MRLIDADELIKDRVKNDNVRIAAKCAPTAYDVDKVVEQLESELRLADKEKERCIEENPLQFYEAKGYARGIAVALDAVKPGGSNEIGDCIGGGTWIEKKQQSFSEIY